MASPLPGLRPQTPTTAPVVLSGANTYTGATTIKGSSLLVSGSLSGSSAVVVGDAANLTTSAILGGSGTVGNVTVGAALGNSGAKLMPHLGSASTAAGTTFHAGSVTFADSAAHLSLEIGRNSVFNASAGDGTAGGDVSDHLSTAGLLSLNGADLQLSLRHDHRYTPVTGDIFFLTINSGGTISGTLLLPQRHRHPTSAKAPHSPSAPRPTTSPISRTSRAIPSPAATTSP
ncbi:MAG: hypothetical protein WDN28_15165 [Chthoniobacter sp.]